MINTKQERSRILNNAYKSFCRLNPKKILFPETVIKWKLRLGIPRGSISCTTESRIEQKKLENQHLYTWDSLRKRP